MYHQAFTSPTSNSFLVLPTTLIVTAEDVGHATAKCEGEWVLHVLGDGDGDEEGSVDALTAGRGPDDDGVGVVVAGRRFGCCGNDEGHADARYIYSAAGG